MQLAISARLAERARTYRRRRRIGRGQAGAPSIIFVDGASHNATVIEVRAPDSLGLLHRLTVALAELGLDIRHATVQTSGPQRRSTVLRAHVARCSKLTRGTPPGRGRTSADACRRVDHVSDAAPPDFTRDLVRWSEALAGIARTGLGFTAEPVRAASGSRRCCTSPPTSRPRPTRRSRSAASRTTSCRSGWSRSARACRATSRRRWRSARSSATTPARSCWCKRADSGIWLYPTGWADVGYSPAEVAVKEVLRGDRHRVRAGAAARRSSTASGWASPGSACTWCCSTAARSAATLQRHPLETAGVGWFARDDAAAADGRRGVVGADGVRRDRRRSDCRPRSTRRERRSGAAEPRLTPGGADERGVVLGPLVAEEALDLGHQLVAVHDSASIGSSSSVELAADRRRRRRPSSSTRRRRRVVHRLEPRRRSRPGRRRRRRAR